MRCDVINNNVIKQCQQSTVPDSPFRIKFPSTGVLMGLSCPRYENKCPHAFAKAGDNYRASTNILMHHSSIPVFLFQSFGPETNPIITLNLPKGLYVEWIENCLKSDNTIFIILNVHVTEKSFMIVTLHYQSYQKKLTNVPQCYNLLHNLFKVQSFLYSIYFAQHCDVVK